MTEQLMHDPLDRAALTAALDDIHRAGMPGVFAEVRDGRHVWRGAAGVADTDTDRPVAPDMRHRVGSISKTFVAAAVLLQVEQGGIRLDDALSHYLPHLLPGRGDDITIRTLINHTSGLAEYLPYAFPSLKPFPRLVETTPTSLDDHRFTRFDRRELIRLGVDAPATGSPGGTPGVYSNTNYLILCELLEHVTGTAAETYITREVVERAGLRHTSFPAGPEIDGPHSRIYESWFAMIDPPRDYSVYDMSWVGPAASLISTVADLNRFFGKLLAGEILSAESLTHMQRTVPVISFEGKTIDYGLGLHRVETPEGGVFWGHDGTVWGAGAMSMTSADGRRQMSIAMNRMRWNTLDSAGRPQPHPIDDALAVFHRVAMARAGDAGTTP